jgi:hypothetical protein
MNRLLLAAGCLGFLALYGAVSPKAPDAAAFPISSPGLPVKPQAPAPAGDTRKLSLWLEQNSNVATYRYADPASLQLILLNRGRSIVSIPEMPTHGNRLDTCSSLYFVLRFADGTVHVSRNDVPPQPGWGTGWQEARFRPLTVAADGESEGLLWVNDAFSHGGAPLTLGRCPAFRLTICVPELKLQSNPVYFNGYKEKQPSPDALKDLEAHLQWEKGEAARSHQRLLESHREVEAIRRAEQGQKGP